MKELTINEINEVSGGPLPAWVPYIGIFLAEHALGRGVDRMFSAFTAGL